MLGALLQSCEAVPVPRETTPPPRTTTQSGGTLRVALEAPIASLDPQDADPNGLAVTRQIFETLVDQEPGGRIVPRLAESWSVTPDGLRWTFTLRTGVRFHDGTELDATAVATSFERARLTAHPLRGVGGDRYRGYAALWGGFDGASVIAKVEAMGPASVAFTTRTPFGPLLAGLAAPVSAIVSPAAMRADPDGWGRIASRGAAGTGPFLLRPGAWEGDGRIALERSGAYWAKDRDGIALPYLDRLEFRPLPDESARVAELRAGTVDVVRDLSAAGVAAVRSDPKLQVVSRPPSSVVLLGIDRATRPLDATDVRRALAAAIDEQALAAGPYAGDARPATQLVPPGTLGYDDTVVEFARLDATAAKRLLADAGAARGFDADLYYSPARRAASPDPRRVAEAVAADLAKIGVSATVRAADPATFRADARAGRFALWIEEWTGESADPDAALGAVLGGADPVIAELVRLACAELDETKRAELYKQVSKHVQRDVLAIPLLHPVPPHALNRKVRGLVALRGGESLAAVWLGR